MTKLTAIIVTSLLMAGCGGSFQRPGEEPPPESAPYERREYDPLGLPADRQIIPQEYAAAALRDSGYIMTPDSAYTAPAPDSLSRPHETYRIQLFTSKTYGPAAREVKIAREVFDREVYLDYEVPYYKVRVGDFPSQSEAENYLAATTEAGYEAAWVVKVIVKFDPLNETGDDPGPVITPAPQENLQPGLSDDTPGHQEN